VSAVHDSGLRVVARVRSVREQDSRLGLVTALAEEEAARSRVADLELQLASVGTHEAGSLTAFAARQRAVAALSQALCTARDAWDNTQLVALAARDRWHNDRTRLAAVESLLERRADARLVELRRRESRELDALAEELWRRGRAKEHSA
jgi:flagellar export protein FliJ